MKFHEIHLLNRKRGIPAMNLNNCKNLPSIYISIKVFNYLGEKDQKKPSTITDICIVIHTVPEKSVEYLC